MDNMTTEPQPAINFESISKKYSVNYAVHDLNLTVNKGELFGFLGLNGAGKTTAMKMATGLVKPTTGNVLISGFNVQKQPKLAKKIVGFVPDSPFVYESLTGREFLYYSAGLYKMTKQQTNERVPILLDNFAIGDWADKRVGEYSHGMKQRLVMASSFLHSPQVIFIDEPMVGLDPSGVKLVKDVLKRFCKDGGTVFLSTHSLNHAEELCDRMAIIHRGKILKIGTLSDIKGDMTTLEDAFLTLTRGLI